MKSASKFKTFAGNTGEIDDEVNNWLGDNAVTIKSWRQSAYLHRTPLEVWHKVVITIEYEQG